MKKNISNDYLQHRDDLKRCMNCNAMAKLFTKLAEESNLTTEGKNYNKLRTHNLRSYFLGTLHNKGFPFTDADFLCGKSLGSSHMTYVENHDGVEGLVKTLKSRYMNYMEHFMFKTTTNIELITDEMIKYQKREEENAQKMKEMEEKMSKDEFQRKIDRIEMKMEIKLSNADSDIRQRKIAIEKMKLDKMPHYKIIGAESELITLEKEREELKEHYLQRIEEIKNKGSVEEDKNWNDEKEENLTIKEIAEKQIKERDEHVK
ncbi:MAG: hypothetical protein ACOCP4_03470, partial [Candidatus Woesearchaeota archaeon]